MPCRPLRARASLSLSLSLPAAPHPIHRHEIRWREFSDRLFRNFGRPVSAACGVVELKTLQTAQSREGGPETTEGATIRTENHARVQLQGSTDGADRLGPPGRRPVEDAEVDADGRARKMADIENQAVLHGANLSSWPQPLSSLHPALLPHRAPPAGLALPFVCHKT